MEDIEARLESVILSIIDKRPEDWEKVIQGILKTKEGGE